MIRSAYLALVLLLVATAPARATRLEVHTDVTGATITAQNSSYAVSGPPPFVTDLPAGRYDLLLHATGRRLGRYTLDVEEGIHLRGTRLSRTISSALLPGSGQWRDDDWRSGMVMGGSFGLMLGQAVYYNVKAGGLRDDVDVPESELSDDLIRTGLDAWISESTRDDYLYLAGGTYIANVIDAFVRRGSVRFTETAPGVVTARYRPTGVGQSMLLSLIVPGLGQVRQGSVGRGRVWYSAVVGTAVFWAQAQRLVYRAESNQKYFEATSTPSDANYLEDLARLESDVDEQAAVARTAGYVAIGIWAYNIADAALATRRAVADSGEMVSNYEEGSSWSVSPGLVGKAAGIVLDIKF